MPACLCACRWGSARGYRLQHTLSTEQVLPDADTFGNMKGINWSKYKVRMYTSLCCQDSIDTRQGCPPVILAMTQKRVTPTSCADSAPCNHWQLYVEKET